MGANAGKRIRSQQSSVPDAVADAATSSAPKAEKTKKTKKTWINRLCSCFQKKDCDSVAEASETTAPQSKKRSKCHFKFWKKYNCRKAFESESESETDQSDPGNAADETSSSLSMTSNEDGAPTKAETLPKLQDQDRHPATPPRFTSSFLEGGKRIAIKVNSNDPFGFPNIENSCYMNSCPQSLFSLQDFIGDISCQEDLWSSVPEAQLLSSVPDAVADAATSSAPKAEKTKKTKKTWKKYNCRKAFESESESESETDQSDPGNAADETSSSLSVTSNEDGAPTKAETLPKLQDQDRHPATPPRFTSSFLEGGKQIAIKVNFNDPFGFPNIGNSCYMNSCLQSLFSLQDFIGDISCQEDLWSSVPEAQLLRRLIDIRDCRESTNYGIKNSRLWSFKRAFATYASDYRDSLQKDAHEFLMLLVNQIQMMSLPLQQHAAVLGQSYTCPVEANFFFQMENTRTCKSCGVQSSHKEDFTGLSLDLVPEASIIGMLEAYLKEKELEFRCECGGMISGLESSFDSLPRVLILHLKRFCITPSYNLEKLHNPIWLQRDLIVSAKEDDACFSLVSIINHYGSTEMGHYTCDSVHPEDRPERSRDWWLTFNDAQVSETTGFDVCEQQQHLAYILLYKRIV